MDADEPDSVPSNDTDEASIRPRPPNLVIDNSLTDNRLEPGEQTELITEVRNRGLGPALNFRVCVTVPTGLTIAKRGGARLRGGKACWRTDRLRKGRLHRYRLVFRAANLNSRRRVCLRATVSGRYIGTRRTRVCTLVLPAQRRRGAVTG